MSFPSQKELEKEIGDYLTQKYGTQVKFITHAFDPEPAKAKKDDPVKVAGGEDPVFNFHLRPEELIGYLDEYVVRQDEAKAVLATKICTHFNRIAYAQRHGTLDRRGVGQVKGNVLLIGPTGVGKTFLIKLIARKLGVPFIKGDATKFSETGYVGGDVEDLVRDLVREANGDIDKAQFGIIYLDEIDKIAASSERFGHDVSRSGVQRALLKPMEETEVELKIGHDPVSQLEAVEYFRTHGHREQRTVNTKNILFIMSGAFTGLEEIVRKRVGRQSIGFESTVGSRKADTRYLKQTHAEDLIEFGFESEFVGRLPVVAILDELSEDDLYQVLLNPNNAVVLGKKQDFRAYGISLAFEDAALRQVAALAARERTGARGLLSVMEKAMLPFEKTLPSREVEFLVITREMVLNPQLELERFLADPGQAMAHAERFRTRIAEDLARLQDFLQRSGGDCFRRREITVSPERLLLLAQICQNENLDSHSGCELICEQVELIRECATVLSTTEMKISFTEEAINRIIARFPRNDQAVREICEQIVKSCDYGLRLLAQKKGIHQVEITGAGIDDPEKFINELVGQSFSA